MILVENLEMKANQNQHGHHHIRKGAKALPRLKHQKPATPTWLQSRFAEEPADFSFLTTMKCNWKHRLYWSKQLTKSRLETKLNKELG